MIRPAVAADLPAIAAIWNPVISGSLVTFTAVEKSPEMLAALLAKRNRGGFGFLVAEIAGEVLSFASYGQFRGGDGYARTMEHTILLAPDARGRGVGRALMAAIEAHAAARGVHSMFAGVSAANPEGIAFHTALGFRELARLPDAGWKWGRAFDLVLMQKIVAAPADTARADG